MTDPNFVICTSRTHPQAPRSTRMYLPAAGLRLRPTFVMFALSSGSCSACGADNVAPALRPRRARRIAITWETPTRAGHARRLEPAQAPDRPAPTAMDFGLTSWPSIRTVTASASSPRLCHDTASDRPKLDRVASAACAARPRAGFMQVCHGKAAPLRRIQPHDRVACYSPTLEFRAATDASVHGARNRVRPATYRARHRDFPPYRRRQSHALSSRCDVRR